MKKIFLAIMFCSFATTAFTAEIKLVCEDKSEAAAWFRKESPSLAVDIFAVDTTAQSVRQLAGELKKMKILSVEISEAEIRFSQSGYINESSLTETFQTTISRVSGRWVRHPHYLDSKGQWVAGAALEQLARSLNLWGPFGVRQRPDDGDCVVGNLKF
jgi:hypothetical protein